MKTIYSLGVILWLGSAVLSLFIDKPTHAIACVLIAILLNEMRFYTGD